ncbi:MAG: hypothetical protein MUE41_01875 [Gemmatimonadaceae bacterium]|jgi:hypothetical protein|nr:hypothetical protein [Gemmatimonadaceae bacterium]
MHRAVVTLSITAALTAGTAVLGAQAPFNTAVLRAGERQARIDAQSYLAPRERGGWVWTLPSVATGLGGGLEVGIGMSQVAPRPFMTHHVDVTLAAKWAPFAGRRAPVDLAVGAFGLLPTQRVRDGMPVAPITFLFVAASRAVRPSRGDASTVLSLAGYAVEGAESGHRHGAMIGIDQPLPVAWATGLRVDALRLNTSWVTGNTLFGYASASLQLFRGPVNVSLGYARGNVAAFNHGPMAGIGIAF